MEQNTIEFDEHLSVEQLRHYLPAQAALKDFVHHNTLHAFQSEKFHEALWKASNIFGYSTYLSIDEFRNLYEKGRISEDILNDVLIKYVEAQPSSNFIAKEDFEYWKDLMLNESFDHEITTRIGGIRGQWKNELKMNLDKVVHPLLFRLLSTFLDQGISIWKFPFRHSEFLESLRELESNKIVSIFKTKRPRKLLLENEATLTDLLDIVVGNPIYYEQYMFDQQFAHPGWSGFVATVEKHPGTLLSHRKISLKDLIYLELLLEIDALDKKFDKNWNPLAKWKKPAAKPLFRKVEYAEVKTILQLWQEAYEWSYFDGVLAGIKQAEHRDSSFEKSFQGLFCIDDREYSFRRQIEKVNRSCETYGTPGFFGVEFYFQPENGKFYTKACPAPVKPKHLIKEEGRKAAIKTEVHFNKNSHSFFLGWIISSTLGFWSAFKLFFNLFKPSISPSMAYSFAHMDKHASLSIDSKGEVENGLSIGYTVEEMVERVEKVLKSINLISNFAPIVYIVGHGGSSVNNPYYAGYDCGACCGRPGSVNARVFAYIANKKEVRAPLRHKGIDIPEETIFIGAMHDTTRDEIEYYDEIIDSKAIMALHNEYKEIFQIALDNNAKERSFRFDTLDNRLPLSKLHKEIKKRSVSLFEPRPEWNHTDNALCIIGRKAMYDTLYLDKRPFINSYDYSKDPEGRYLMNILSAAVPVCGGINLEYYFSRVDQLNLGSGTKLPHNVVGLFAVNNGLDGDLRPGLPSQMIEIHEPVRILFVIEQDPGLVLKVIQSDAAIYEWIINEWVLLTVKDPSTKDIYRFKDGQFILYKPLKKRLKAYNIEDDLLKVIKKIEPTLIKL